MRLHDQHTTFTLVREALSYKRDDADRGNGNVISTVLFARSVRPVLEEFGQHWPGFAPWVDPIVSHPMLEAARSLPDGAVRVRGPAPEVSDLIMHVDQLRERLRLMATIVVDAMGEPVRHWPIGHVILPIVLWPLPDPLSLRELKRRVDALELIASRPAYSLMGQDVLVGRAEHGSVVLDLLSQPLVQELIVRVFEMGVGLLAFKSQLDDLKKQLAALQVTSNIEEKETPAMKAYLDARVAELVAKYGVNKKASQTEVESTCRFAITEASTLLEGGAVVEAADEHGQPKRILKEGPTRALLAEHAEAPPVEGDEVTPPEQRKNDKR